MSEIFFKVMAHWHRTRERAQELQAEATNSQSDAKTNGIGRDACRKYQHQTSVISPSFRSERIKQKMQMKRGGRKLERASMKEWCFGSGGGKGGGVGGGGGDRKKTKRGKERVAKRRLREGKRE